MDLLRRFKRIKYGKMTLEEAETLLSSVLDYQKILIKLHAADPVQHRVLPIFKKYNIMVERNELADQVTPEKYLEMVEELQGR